VHTVEIPLAALNRVDLPPVCPITGATDGVEFRKIELTWYPRWITLFALPALLIAVILAAVMTRRAKGELPFAPGAYWRWKLGQGVFGVTVIAGAIGLIIAIVMMNNQAVPPGAATLGVSVLLPLAVWLFAVRGRGLAVESISDRALFLRMPSESAARAFREKLAGGISGVTLTAARILGKSVEATTAAPEGAYCATHPTTLAQWSCGRCGSFFCAACARRPSAASKPLCASCFTLQVQVAETASAFTQHTRFVVWGAICAVLCLLPTCWPAALPSFVLNGVALYRALKVEAEQRPRSWWVPGVSLMATAGGWAMWFVLGVWKL
jgi:hypothetical protein